MDMRKLAVFPTLLALALVGCGGTETADPPPAEETSAVPPPTSETTVSATLGEYEVATDLTYADGSLVDVYRPAPEGPWPVAVFVHGRGTSNDATFYGRALAESGAVAYVVSVSINLHS